MRAKPCVPGETRSLYADDVPGRKCKRSTEFGSGGGDARARRVSHEFYRKIEFPMRRGYGSAERRNAESATASNSRKRSRRSAGSDSRKMSAVRCTLFEACSSNAM